ncbi:shikimate kinase [Marinagarivorans cellulosilyticus]|uniref:Shikimate kinase n=1 Tax=Marinagarivorans cellulosilyticus TaxID=2721545 RepID=A0AAN1WEG2_9GAMM|nr:shikimate kinase [Marinagarivorans cellulosilyticus]BCD96072.1 shikimate kinase [Marinagarivorans cellulosilyticus]
MSKHSNIVLVGPMGAGKSTVGRLLASRLGFSFVDTDSVIEDRTGADIPWIFDVEGEEGFRARETAVLRDLLEENASMVIATGGGIVTQPENIALLRKLGRVFFLQASLEQLTARTSKDKKRPLLQVKDPKAKIKELLELRAPLYEAAAHANIMTDVRGAKGVVHQICAQIEA